MASINNPVKVFDFAIEIDGLNQFLVQEVNIPAIEIEAAEHGDSNSKVKTAGMVNVEDITLKKLVATDVTESWAWDWLNAAQNMNTGGGGLSSAYRRNIVIRQFNPDRTTKRYWICQAAWVKRIEHDTQNRMASDNMFETVTLSVDKIRLVTP
jgi:phage tail-like protein